MKPLIGIIGKYEKLASNNKIMYSYLSICDKIIEAGGNPIQINLLKSNINSTYDILETYIDGIIFQGGDDYTNEELELIQYAYKKDIPILGICLGMQTIALALDGSLKEIKNHNNKEMHTVKIKNNTKAYEIFKKKQITVNTRHNFAVNKTSLVISGISEDKTIEIIEDSTKKFVLGIQWHPESLENIDTKNLFNYFIKKAGEKYDNVK